MSTRDGDATEPTPAAADPVASVPPTDEAGAPEAGASNSDPDLGADADEPVGGSPADAEVDADPPDTDPEPAGDTDAATEPDALAVADGAGPGRSRRPTRIGLTVALLCALLGVGLAAQLRHTDQQSTLTIAREGDLVRILDELEARDQRLRAEANDLETRRQALTSEAEGSENALTEVRRRADELGILAGTAPARGSGVVLTFAEADGRLEASILLDAVEELRGAGAEAMQVSGVGTPPVRIVASTAFVDGRDGVVVDGRALRAPYVLTVIGEPPTMIVALGIPGGVTDSVQRAGGTVQIDSPRSVAVNTVRPATVPRYARPVR